MIKLPIANYDLTHNPELGKFTKHGKLERSQTSAALRTTGQLASQDTLYKSTKHWKTNYGNNNNEMVTNPINKSERPLWSYPRQAYTSGRGTFQSQYMSQLGTYGHNPRKILNQDSDKMTNEATDMK
jgi:hypothetical protein